MDGMPLTLEQIQSFYNDSNLEAMLEDLTQKGYLKFEYPKKLIREKMLKVLSPLVGIMILVNPKDIISLLEN